MSRSSLDKQVMGLKHSRVNWTPEEEFAHCAACGRPGAPAPGRRLSAFLVTFLLVLLSAYPVGNRFSKAAGLAQPP